jgi:hypothetical protein
LLTGPAAQTEQDAAAIRWMGLPAQALARTDEVEAWPENAAAVRLFDAMLTQWRMGPRVPVGLDYTALPVVQRRAGLRCRPGDFRALQVMEAEALRWFAEKARH